MHNNNNNYDNQEEAIGRIIISSLPDGSGSDSGSGIVTVNNNYSRVPQSGSRSRPLGHKVNHRHRQPKKSHAYRSSVVYVYGTFVAVVVIVLIELTTVLRSSGSDSDSNGGGSSGYGYKISHRQASALQELLLLEEDSSSSDSSPSDSLDSPSPPPPYSLRQNRSFFRSLPCIMEWINTSRRLYHHEMVGDCSEEWAYMHVLKAGGTTVQRQCNTSSFAVGFENPVFLTHKLFTFVRDPIDHFIAGFKESASRPGGSSYQPTNESISRYLERRLSNSNFQHSIPQIEFLIYHPPPPRRNNNNRNLPIMSRRRRPTTTTRPPPDDDDDDDMLLPDTSPERYLKRIKFVGEMKDMEKFMKHQQLPWNETLVEKRHYETKRRFDGLRNKLSMDVVEKICEYKMIDYCFFDFNPPDVCRHMVESFCQRTCRQQQQEDNNEEEEDQEDNNEGEDDR
mmetsp:Transcript_33991/g.81693  ORF Transcript_33991/g.81693 Transcript_33991/m.81693 type:complete len:451 (+) Transcript_33991:174-1526(+)